MSEAREIHNNAIPRIATGLCGGMARTGGMCGAVSGAILAIGLVGGRDSAKESVEPAYVRVQSLLTGFTELHGTTSCPGLIECDLATEEGRQTFGREHRIERCQRYVEDAARLADDLLRDVP